MNSNCDNFIKQEFLDEDEIIDRMPWTDLNTSINNGSNANKSFPKIAVKTEFVEENVEIKTEIQKISRAKDSFIINKLKKPPTTRDVAPLIQQIGKQSCSSTSQIQMTDISHTNDALVNNNTSLVSNLTESQLKNGPANVVIPAVSVSPPILLNAQFRKRHKVIASGHPIDKRARYNIEGTTSAPAHKNVTTYPIKASNACRLLSTGNRKIINHSIKRKQSFIKQKQGKLEKICPLQDASTITLNSDNEDARKTFVSNTKNQGSTRDSTRHDIKQNAAKNFSSSKVNNSSDSTKQSAGPDARVMPELRVKCLCTLTDDSSSDNLELKTFFKQMFEETRRLKKTQQRKIKVELLKAISDAEDLMEQGKCCSF